MPHTRPINDAEKQNFDTLVSAIKSDRACLLSVRDLRHDRPTVLICAVNYYPDAEECFEFVPLAALCGENPYERFAPPNGESPRDSS
jgi:hypothetical protein